jgi:probable rRNA maturation factor
VTDRIAMPALDIHVMSEQAALPVDASRIRRAVRRVLSDAGIRRGVVSVAVVDDATIRRLNARHLGHDEATDVLSFVLERTGDALEGEIVVSAQTAAAQAPRFDSDAAGELLLYVIHGALHLVGYDDSSEAPRAQMQERERHYLQIRRKRRGARCP